MIQCVKLGRISHPYDTLHACIVNGNSVYMAWNIFVAGVNPKPTDKGRQVARLVAGPVHLANDETRQTRNLATI